jgi:Mrp family chromosome partitioning ATPase
MLNSTTEQQSDRNLSPEEVQINERFKIIKAVLLVMSGKGGVGKSTVAVNLALTFAAEGKNVGILDIDLHGPNIAKLLGIEQERLAATPDGIEPVEILPNLKAVSLALLGMDPDQPVIWRGPLKTGAIKQFLGEVNWGELDYLIIDAPPGTGDEPLSVVQLIPQITGAIIVTTPQDVAILDSRKSVLFAKRLHMPVVGIIENMSGLTCPHCHQPIYLFKQGGGQKAADELNVNFLGALPIQPELVEYGDAGRPFLQMQSDSDYVQRFKAIAAKVAEFVGN